jgi:hypothetical protein
LFSVIEGTAEVPLTVSIVSKLPAGTPCPCVFGKNKGHMAVRVDWKKATAASQDVVTLLLEVYKDQRGVHVETVIGAAAALAGAQALRAASPLLPGTQYVVSAEADDLLMKGSVIGQSLTGIILQFAENVGVARSELPDPREINNRVIAAFGTSPFPPLSVPQVNYPREWSPDATVRLRDRLDFLLVSKELNAIEGAVACVAATASLIKMTVESIDPKISTTLALEIMIAVSHMRPLGREFGAPPPA